MNSSNIKNSSTIPGPGTYQISSTIKVQVSLSKQNTQKRFKPYQSLVPGPGQYNSLPSQITTGPKALILSRSKQHKVMNIPGPGSYQPDFKKIIKSQSGYLLPKGQRGSLQHNNKIKLPGPGAYQTSKSTLLNQKNAIAFGPQRKIKLADERNVPGPGQYNLAQSRLTLQNAPKPIFSKAGRSQSYVSIAPGPGAYKTLDNFKTDKKKGFSISIKTSSTFQKKQKIPGPGSYQIQEIDKLKYKSASFSMPKSPRLKTLNEKQLLSIPGPQKYNVNITAFEHKSFTLGKQFRKSLAENKDIPGPGSYQIKNQSQLPKFSIPKSNISWIKSNNTPGPANYEPKLMGNTQYNAISMNKDQRKPFYDQKKNIPGPGQYTINELLQKKGGFTVGHQKRQDLGSSRDKVPGPGEYNFHTTLKGAKDMIQLK